MAWSKGNVTYGYKVEIDLNKLIDRIIDGLKGQDVDVDYDGGYVTIRMEHETSANVWHCAQTLESPAEWDVELVDSIADVNVQSIVEDAVHSMKYEELKTRVEIEDSGEWIWEEDEPDYDRAYDEWRDRRWEK